MTTTIYYLWARKTTNPPAPMSYPADAGIEAKPAQRVWAPPSRLDSGRPVPLAAAAERVIPATGCT